MVCSSFLFLAIHASVTILRFSSPITCKVYRKNKRPVGHEQANTDPGILALSSIVGRLDKSNSHLFSKPLLSKDRLSGVNPWHNYQMLSKTDAI